LTLQRFAGLFSRVPVTVGNAKRVSLSVVSDCHSFRNSGLEQEALGLTALVDTQEV